MFSSLLLARAVIVVNAFRHKPSRPIRRANSTTKEGSGEETGITPVNLIWSLESKPNPNGSKTCSASLAGWTVNMAPLVVVKLKVPTKGAPFSTQKQNI